MKHDDALIACSCELKTSYMHSALIRSKIVRSPWYFKFRKFCENFIFANNIKRHICDVKNLRLGHALPILVIHRVICHSARVLFPRNSKFRENKTLTKISKFTVLSKLCFDINLEWPL